MKKTFFDKVSFPLKPFPVLILSVIITGLICGAVLLYNSRRTTQMNASALAIESNESNVEEQGKSTNTSSSMEFQLRYDVIFNDSRDTVKQKLTKAVGNNEFYEYSNSISVHGLTLSGISNSFVSFNFSDSNIMNDYSITYKLMEYMPRSDIMSEYNTINEGLTRKYGSPLDSSSGLHPIEGEAIKTARMESNLYGLNEWVVDCGKYYVKIDHVSCGYTAGNEECVTHLVSYHYFTQEEVDARQKITQYLNEYLNTKIDDDL